MRMEELSNNNFIKSTDSVERYLLNVVQSYFNSMNLTDANSREYIIQKAVERMKEEFLIDNAGVLSVNGLTGEVTITIEDLGGEPTISIKHSAFNVDFGNQKNTACEGNDSRLSDARTPKPHTHNINDIVGLSGMISSIENSSGKIEDYKHDHTNKNILDKITYNGNKATIDLTFLDTIDTKLSELEENIDNTISPLPAKIDNSKEQFDNTLTDKSNAINDYITSTNAKIEELNANTASQIDSKFKDIEENVASLTNNQVDLSSVNEVLNQINLSPRLLVSGEFTITDDGQMFKTGIETIASDENFSNLNFDYDLVIQTTDNKTIVHKLPYNYIEDNIQAVVTAGTCGNNQIEYNIVSKDSALSTKVSSLTLRYRGYGMKPIQLL